MEIKKNDCLLEDSSLDFYEKMFSALSDKNRLKIISEINKSSEKKLCVCDLEEILDLKQSKLSYHLKQLVNANILSVQKQGTWNYYSLNEKQIQLLLTEDTCCRIL